MQIIWLSSSFSSTQQHLSPRLNSMASLLTSASISPNLHSLRDNLKFLPTYCSIDRQRAFKLRCDMKNPASTSSSSPSSISSQESEPENLLLKMAWYGSELLGIAASFIRSPKNVGAPQERPVLEVDGSGVIDRNKIVETIKDDFEKSYFVTGNLTLDAYEEDCEFADPAGSFRGLRRFKRNCTNFGSLLERSTMKLMKWEDFEEKAVGHWRFSCTLSFPWKPILSATGYTEYYFNDQSGKACGALECPKDGFTEANSEAQPRVFAEKIQWLTNCLVKRKSTNINEHDKNPSNPSKLKEQNNYTINEAKIGEPDPP